MSRRLELVGGAALAVTLALPAFAQEAHDGPPPMSEEDQAISAALQTRMGDTSTLMETVPIPESAAECGDTPGYERMLCLIDLLKADVSDENLERLQLGYSRTEAEYWSNLPAGAFPKRPGVLLGELNTKQRGLVKAIMMEATSHEVDEGFDEMVQTLNADDYINTVSTDYKAGYSSFNTKFAFLGTPGDSGVWELYYGGHHMGFANTYVDGVLAGATPSFRGVEPFPYFEMNGRVNHPLTQERDAFATLLSTLSDDQRTTATLEGTYRDILAGPQADDAVPDSVEGLAVSELDKDQQALLLTAIRTYVGDITEPEASAYMAKYTAELPETYLGYSGTEQISAEDDYVRVHGPSLWIEFSLQSNKSTEKVGNHPHSVWRDLTNDYGGQTE
ncbi:DUF3500 domain-containing protein [Pseudooceanicola algae]|uniref:DUF3500 domain-containing protein n=1 Tax=Pseudooceanicola algae TaxID=1537215 RepID=A0A418SHA9_9RHOB|nr:DUF3500 domain-containing protein [Pseudooceanicola algae]QPM90445.1 hypothetical protein PSAL_016830 [Pseudooceanicola algae]